ncbi:hypothetical protein [Rheinheimera sp.]|jgi:type IV secretory pathway VirB4 component|uniref:hypothetical protein n=1 Tax=Rheinheimera sp. TaxID=1869214 RepID=UPI0023535934|nr:hypothetical protein [Rheinheimera sp.]
MPANFDKCKTFNTQIGFLVSTESNATLTECEAHADSTVKGAIGFAEYDSRDGFITAANLVGAVDKSIITELFSQIMGSPLSSRKELEQLVSKSPIMDYTDKGLSAAANLTTIIQALYSVFPYLAQLPF